MAEMRTLLLLRHAKSTPAGAGMDDFDRPLAPRGRQAGQAVARLLAAAPPALPAVILCSAARRTCETLELVRPALPDGAEERIERSLYLAGPDRLLTAIRALPAAAASVMLIGHNPGLHELALMLCRSGDAELRARLIERFPTAALATIGLDGPWSGLKAGAGRLLAYAAPRDLD